MKNVFLISLIMILVGVLTFFGCAGQGPASTSTSGEMIKLRLTHPIPPMSIMHRGILVPWTEMIKERTTAIGKPVEITIFGAQTLGKLLDQYDMVVRGSADICGIVGPGTQTGRFPLNEVMDLPFMFPSATAAALTAQELFDTEPEFADEFSETKILFFQPTGTKQISSRTKQIKTLEDIKGLKANGTGGMEVEALGQLGAAPLTIQLPEVYIALERGALDLAVENWEGTKAFRINEVTKYRTVLPRGLFLTNLICAMNWDSWNSLPPDVQEVFNELTGAYMSEFAGNAFDEEDAAIFQAIQETDKEVGNPAPYYIPEDEFQRWLDAVNPMYEDWIQRIEAKGLPGRAIFEKAQRLSQKYSK